MRVTTAIITALAIGLTSYAQNSPLSLEECRSMALFNN